MLVSVSNAEPEFCSPTTAIVVSLVIFMGVHPCKQTFALDVPLATVTLDPVTPVEPCFKYMLLYPELSASNFVAYDTIHDPGDSK
jgi:hypothetical protein